MTSIFQIKPEENYEEKKEETAHDIVAADDGLITEMITRSGTPAVTVGTPVKKGADFPGYQPSFWCRRF